MSKVRVAVFGASGYAGEELLRILLRHPNAEVVAITSRKNAGEPVSTVFPRFTGAPLTFVEPKVDEIAAKCDAAILALPHGLATEYAIPLLKAGVKVFDISADFRLKSAAKYKEYYKVDHPAPELLAKAVYGLPERYRDQLRTADLVACAGCYPTSSILPTAPLLAAKLVKPTGIAVVSCSGVTGAGRKVDLPYIFPECNESLKAYGVVGHRHLPEIEQEMAFAAGVPEMAINFIPHLAPMNRCINSTILMDAADGCTLEKIGEVYEQAYGKEQFVRILPAKRCADTKYVSMTNTCEIGYNLDPHTNKVIVTSVIDNLTKGASGQAVQCMNIRFGLDEAAGLI
ncbi:N-acetyl-gamma-glutamyl-phosphate reductase [Victivallis vadensis]|uniref:N-acetyl-gamma-glutamyl-phosphate reductase n=1 Tax=Victivallis vadensis TaxID=172901 RepID=A0A2U1B4B9_9BACT|nr:N-acetyl-gamma-glutamyl-phosphate reductase [Victivallis vadensis]NMD85035.1 N-acetyl-gamma-glutamyl-phosphate reductase [Victivallis vadensis]PVY43525.1 N-acetyl-gamma-glutamyl-phosphate reductase [Victivallis vadensis]